MQNIYPDLMITMISGNNKKKMYFSRFQLYAYPGCQRLFSHGFRFLSSFYKRPAQKKTTGAERYCFDSADPVISTVKSAGADFGHDG